MLPNLFYTICPVIYMYNFIVKILKFHACALSNQLYVTQKDQWTINYNIAM